jgi:hypothetical protein
MGGEKRFGGEIFTGRISEKGIGGERLLREDYRVREIA